MLPVVNYNTFGYCFDLMLCKKIDLKFKKSSLGSQMTTKAINLCQPQVLIHYFKLSIIIF